MIGLIQVVTFANVKVNDKIVGAIERGILALIGIEKHDSDAEGKKLVDKILRYRIFPDAEGKTNLSVQDIRGGLLLVPQFTLVAETDKGLRPSFSAGINKEAGLAHFAALVAYASDQYAQIATGEYGAYMQVSLCNDGPMTFYLRV